MSKKSLLSIDRVWRTVHCCAVTFISCYLSYMATQRYLLLTTSVPYFLRFGEQVDHEMIVYFALLGAHVVAISFFCLFSFTNTRNYANDGYRFGYSASWFGCSLGSLSSGRVLEEQVKKLHKKLHLERFEMSRLRSIGDQVWYTVVRCWQHFLPTCSVLHLLSAYCLLLAHMVIKRACIAAILSKHDRASIVSESDTSNALSHLTATEFDRIFRRSAFFVLPGSVSNSHRNATQSSSNNTSSQPGTSSSTSTASASRLNYCIDDQELPVEFLNYVFSLLVLTFRYPAVICRANRKYGFMLGCVLAVQSVTAILDFEAVSVLYRVDCCTEIRALFLNAWVSVLLVTIGNCVQMSTCVLIFEFGWKIMRRTLRGLFNASDYRVQSPVDESLEPASHNSNAWLYLWREFSTHFHAHMLFAVGVILKLPYLWDLVVYYRNVGDLLFISATFANAIGALCWTAVWFLLTVTRNSWDFRLLSQPLDIIDRQCTRSYTIATILSTASAPIMETNVETESVSVSDAAFRFYVPQSALAATATELPHASASCTFPDLQLATPSSKQSLKRKSILRSATQTESLQDASSFHDQFDHVAMKVNNPVVVNDAHAASSYAPLKRTVLIAENGNVKTNGQRQSVALVRVQTSTESVSSDSGCVPQSGPSSSIGIGIGKRSALLQLRVASPSLPSPTSVQSGATNELTHPHPHPHPDACDNNCSGEHGKPRAPSMVVDCPMHGIVYWPSRTRNDELVFSEV